VHFVLGWNKEIILGREQNETDESVVVWLFDGKCRRAAREALRIWHQSLGRLELLMRAGGNRNSQLISRAAETSEHLRRRVLLYYSKMQIHVRTTRGRAKRKCVSAFNHFAHTQIYFNSISPDERVSPCVFLSRVWRQLSLFTLFLSLSYPAAHFSLLFIHPQASF
jgi:hypothetical protein